MMMTRERVKNGLDKCFIMRICPAHGRGEMCSEDLDFDHNGQLMNFNGHSLVTTSPAAPRARDN